jgi:hypothetical protein
MVGRYNQTICLWLRESHRTYECVLRERERERERKRERESESERDSERDSERERERVIE